MAVESVSLLSITITANLLMMLPQFPHDRSPEASRTILVAAFVVNMIAMFAFLFAFSKSAYDTVTKWPFIVRLLDTSSPKESVLDNAVLRSEVQRVRTACEMAHKRWYLMNENMKAAVDELLELRKRVDTINSEMQEAKTESTRRMKAADSIAIAQLVNQLAAPASEGRTAALRDAVEKASSSIGNYDAAVAFIVTHIEQASTSTDEAYFEKLDGLLLDLFKVEEELLVQQKHLKAVLRDEIGSAAGIGTENHAAKNEESGADALTPFGGLQLACDNAPTVVVRFGSNTPAKHVSPCSSPDDRSGRHADDDAILRFATPTKGVASAHAAGSGLDIPLSPEAEGLDAMRPMQLSPARDMFAPAGGERESPNDDDDDEDALPATMFGATVVNVLELDYEHDVTRENGYDGVMP
jgi:hypothetical protein